MTEKDVEIVRALLQLSLIHIFQSMTRIILIGNTSREAMENSEQTKETIPPCSLTMGIATFLSAKSIYLTAWGEEKMCIRARFPDVS